MALARSVGDDVGESVALRNIRTALSPTTSPKYNICLRKSVFTPFAECGDWGHCGAVVEGPSRPWLNITARRALQTFLEEVKTVFQKSKFNREKCIVVKQGLELYVRVFACVVVLTGFLGSSPWIWAPLPPELNQIDIKVTGGPTWPNTKVTASVFYDIVALIKCLYQCLSA